MDNIKFILTAYNILFHLIVVIFLEFIYNLYVCHNFAILPLYLYFHF